MSRNDTCARIYWLSRKWGGQPATGLLQVLEEARAVGAQIRQHLCEQIRVIHHDDRAEDVIHIRMFLPTRKNFLEHLTHRVLRP